MQIQGEKIVLRSVLPTDADLLYKWENNKDNWDVSGTKKPYTKKEIEDFITKQKDVYLDRQLRLMISAPIPAHPDSPIQERKRRNGETGSGSEIGCIDLFEYNDKILQAGIGILIEEPYRKNGYASEALALLAEYSFSTLLLKKLYCNISDNNTASMKLFQKLGFVIKGKDKDICYLELVNPSSILQ